VGDASKYHRVEIRTFATENCWILESVEIFLHLLLDTVENFPYKGGNKRQGVGMDIGRQTIADAAMVSKGVVHKAVASGRLDEGSLVSITSYVMLGRLSAGGLKEITGKSCEPRVREVEDFPQPTTHLDYGDADDVPETPAGADDNIEPLVMDGMLAQGKTLLFIDKFLRGARADVGAPYLREEHLSDLGL
jgi:hypothetical protein